MRDHDLEAQFRAQIRRPASRAACPAPELLLAAAERGAPDAVRLQVLEHVATCPDCRADYEVARALLQSAAAPVAQRRWQPWALAAAMALAVGLVATLQLQTPETEVTRGDSTTLSLRGSEVRGTTVRFAWQPADSGSIYMLEIIDDAGNLQYSTRTSDTMALVPSDSLDADRTLAWSVLALQPDGTEQRSGIRTLVRP